MPVIGSNIPAYKGNKSIPIDWNTFRRGLNILLRETELNKDELSQADNLMLIGAGVPTRRWGAANYFMAGATGAIRTLKGYYTTNVNELLTMTDEGILVKQSGASYSVITGASWASGYDAQMVQLNNNMYI